MKKYIVSIFAFSLFFATASAQQEAMYSQYMFNSLAINPAYAGSRNITSATALARNQWIGVDGAPKTLTLTIDAPINEKKIGLGLQVFTDKIGVTQTTGAIASYAYRIRMLRKGTLSFGLQGGYSQYSALLSTVPLNTGSQTDVAFIGDVNKGLLNLGAGVYYNSDRFYIGLSAPQILNNKLDNFDVKVDNVYSGRAMHLFLATGYVIPLNYDLDLKTSTLIKGVKGAPLQADLNANLWIKNTIAFGLQYRTSADIGAMIELQASPQIRLGYAYDRSTTKLVEFNSGSHEIMLRYEFGYDKGKIVSPRFF